MNDKPISAKEYLSQAYRIDQRINAKLEQLEHLRALSRKSTVSYGAEPVSRTRNVTAMEDSIVRLIDLENEINRDIDHLVDFKREIYGVLQKIQDPELQLLLELRYLCFKNWSEISVALELEGRYVFKVHSRALAEVAKILSTRAVKDIERQYGPVR
jgi:DNA-directed RNA polymerase specialized sigma subunit